ncbi:MULTISPECIES: tetratricopeptide repeat protein [Sphingobium]|uniref:tetratricopeptide repeat protein n=1 Tax=Sphingobium TaxID=165695 RepID=UPI0015EBC388|nr:MULTISPECIES: tetratricopeptide repeat protein [Sphingobium]MCW2362089.1 hypothetical protein [Sphingobium sp. B10D3B]MCW2401232.1 hypothetical protein [Sphingobium sp. B10D7B]MCW2408212.1 hypothetical protein [Sphingobium xanthum]
MALTPHQNEALLREIDDAVRQDDLLSFWKNYGRLVIAVVVLGLAAFGGWLYWQHHQTQKAEANGEQFARLMSAAQRATLDDGVYKQIMAEGGPGYRAQAEMLRAALAGGRNDAKTALAAYDAILADAQAPAATKDAALMRRTALAFDSMKPQDVIAALKPLAMPGNSWFGSAGELTAIAHLKAGQRDQAGKIFNEMANDPLVPESIKLRAGQMASMLGSATTPKQAGPTADTPAS